MDCKRGTLSHPEPPVAQPGCGICLLHVLVVSKVSTAAASSDDVTVTYVCLVKACASAVLLEVCLEVSTSGQVPVQHRAQGVVGKVLVCRHAGCLVAGGSSCQADRASHLWHLVRPC